MAGTVVAVEGPSGAGKSTVVRSAAQEFGWVALPEAYDRLEPRPSLEYRTPAELERLELLLLREDAARFVESRRAADGGATVLADTGFLGALTYTWALARQGRAPATLLPPLVAEAGALARRMQWGMPDLVLWLRTTEATRLARSRSALSTHPPRLDPRHAEVAREEHEFYRGAVARRFPGLFRTVSGAGTLRSVVARVHREVLRVRALASSPGRIESILAVLGTTDSVP